MLRLPSLQSLMQRSDSIDIERLIAARKQVQQHIAHSLSSHWPKLYTALHAALPPYRFEAEDCGRRAWLARVLSYWLHSDTEAAIHAADRLYHSSDNMTDTTTALHSLINSPKPTALTDQHLQHFYQHWQQDTQMVEQWLSLQASAEPVTVAQIQTLSQHPCFDWTNPNKIRALIGGFTLRNPAAFHQQADTAYTLLTDAIVRLNRSNPQIAARLCTPLLAWRRFIGPRQQQLQACLQRIQASPDLSADVFEVVSNALQ